MEYFSSGIENKTIYNKLTGELVSINNQNNKSSYERDFLLNTTIQLSNDQLDEINELIASNDLNSLESMDGIVVEETYDGLIVNLDISNNSSVNSNNIVPLSTPSYKTNATPITSSFPILNKSIVATKTQVSPALVAYNKPDTNVYAKVMKTRNNYVQVKFDYKTFAVNTTLAVIGVFLGAGTTIVAQVCYYASIGTAIVGTAQSITEIADIARDAMYTYSGEKNGYVFDKTVFNKDVRVITNYGQGTFDGGLLPSGQWAWIESPPSSAFSITDISILDKTISNYNSAIYWGEGYCTNYLPD